MINPEDWELRVAVSQISNMHNNRKTPKKIWIQSAQKNILLVAWYGFSIPKIVCIQRNKPVEKPFTFYTNEVDKFFENFYGRKRGQYRLN